MKKIIAIASVVLFAACGTVKLPAPSQADANKGAAKYPGYSLADLANGKAAYEKTCTSCHKLKSPASKKASQWEKIVPEMAAKAKKKAHGNEVISSKEQETILHYLVAMSKK